MKMAEEHDDDMRPEYDFSKGVRGAFVQRFQELNLVSLEPDLKAVFPDSPAVNAALRELLERREKERQQHADAA